MEVNRKPVIDTAAEADFGDEGCRCPDEVDEGKQSQDILISGFDGRTPSSAAAAAENLELRETRIAAAVCRSGWFGARRCSSVRQEEQDHGPRGVETQEVPAPSLDRCDLCQALLYVLSSDQVDHDLMVMMHHLIFCSLAKATGM